MLMLEYLGIDETNKFYAMVEEFVSIIIFSYVQHINVLRHCFNVACSIDIKFIF